MINHARTLMINLAQNNAALDHDGEDYIDPDFVPVVQDQPYIVPLRNILFGTNPDRFTLNYRATQYAISLHKDPITQPWVKVLDPLITYLNSYWFDYRFGNILTTVDSYIMTMQVFGGIQNQDNFGRNVYNYKITAYSKAGRDFVEVEHTNGTSPLIGVLFNGSAYVDVPLNNDLDGAAGELYLRITYNNGTSQASFDSLKSSYINFDKSSKSKEGLWLLNSKFRPSRTIQEIVSRLDNLTLPSNVVTEHGLREYYDMARRGETVHRRLNGWLYCLIKHNQDLHAK